MTSARPWTKNSPGKLRELYTQHEQCLANAPGKSLPREGPAQRQAAKPYTGPGMTQGKSVVKKAGSAKPAWASIWPNSAGERVGLGAGTGSNSNLTYQPINGS